MTYARGTAAAAFFFILTGLLLVAFGFMSTTMTGPAWMEWGGYCWVAGVTLNIVGLVVAGLSGRRRRLRANV